MLRKFSLRTFGENKIDLVMGHVTSESAVDPLPLRYPLVFTKLIVKNILPLNQFL